MPRQFSQPHIRRAVRILVLLLLLFFCRVLGQFLVFLGLAPALPPMHEWYSGLLPYGTLLACQLLLLAAGFKVVRDIATARGYFGKPHPTLALGMGIFGALYAASMAIRYGVTMILHPERRWFGGTIPILFHFVIAAFILILARHLKREGRTS
jgi:hypothetical protein